VVLQHAAQHLPPFDSEAKRAGVRYDFVGLSPTSWRDLPEPAGVRKLFVAGITLPLAAS
jgi:hypothetical protein